MTVYTDLSLMKTQFTHQIFESHTCVHAHRLFKCILMPILYYITHGDDRY